MLVLLEWVFTLSDISFTPVGMNFIKVFKLILAKLNFMLGGMNLVLASDISFWYYLWHHYATAWYNTVSGVKNQSDTEFNMIQLYNLPKNREKQS